MNTFCRKCGYPIPLDAISQRTEIARLRVNYKTLSGAYDTSCAELNNYRNMTLSGRIYFLLAGLKISVSRLFSAKNSKSA